MNMATAVPAILPIRALRTKTITSSAMISGKNRRRLRCTILRAHHGER